MDPQDSESPSPPESSRRAFVKAAVGVLSLLASAVMIWPLVAAIVGSSYRPRQRRMRKIASMSDLSQGRPVRVSFPYVSQEAFIQVLETRDVWVIKHSETEVTVFSPVCTHLSCRYDWNPRSGNFVCPCHGSVFAATGQVLAGPAPRPLDTLPWKIEDGQLLIEWETFESGISQKVPL